MFLRRFNFSQIRLANANEIKEKPSVENLKFGHDFTDHMLRIKWNDKEGWKQPQITPLTYMRMHPAAKVLHYAQELYEGMKVHFLYFHDKTSKSKKSKRHDSQKLFCFWFHRHIEDAMIKFDYFGQCKIWKGCYEQRKGLVSRHLMEKSF